MSCENFWYCSVRTAKPLPKIHSGFNWSFSIKSERTQYRKAAIVDTSLLGNCAAPSPSYHRYIWKATFPPFLILKDNFSSHIF
ncbi:MAG: hypothetical protein AYK19_21520 [Theionarchaea archaeon DG-70-1]|nr:MAG: hypothetical protein AYK19_21520 [Theionarchaea archaeon DG-70-1]